MQGKERHVTAGNVFSQYIITGLPGNSLKWDGLSMRQPSRGERPWSLESDSSGTVKPWRK